MSHIKTALVLGVCLFLAACGGRPEYEYADNKDVRIEKITSRSMEGGFLEITAELRNSSKSAVHSSRYQVLWFDKDGFLLEETSWRPVRVTGGAPAYVRERSTRPGAKDFTLVLSNEAR